MTVESSSEAEIFYPGYVDAAKSYEAEAQASGISRHALSVLSDLDPNNKVLQQIMHRVNRDQSLETPASQDDLLAAIASTAVAAETTQHSQLKSAQHCRELAATPPQHASDTFAG